MGIFSTLLSIGTCVGKVCQVIAGGMSQTVEDEATGAVLSENTLNYDKLLIGMYKNDASGKMTLHALNTSGSEKTVQFPPDANNNSMLYSIASGCKQSIEREISMVENPDDPIQISTVDDVSSLGVEGNGGVAVKFHVKNLVYGKPDKTVDIYGHQFSASGDKLLVNDGDFGGMTFCGLASQTGVAMTYTQTVKAEQADNKSSFDVGFSQCGFKEGDILSGMLEFTMGASEWKANKERMKKFYATKGVSQQEPMTETDLALIRKLGIEPECRLP